MFTILLNFVKNWAKEFKDHTFAPMKKYFQPQLIFKYFSILMLTAVLVLSPCGTKKSLKEIFHIGKLSSHSFKMGSSCHFVQLSTNKKSQQTAVKQVEFQTSARNYSAETSPYTSTPTGFRKARSVPLYILYHQFRFSLV